MLLKPVPNFDNLVVSEVGDLYSTVRNKLYKLKPSNWQGYLVYNVRGTKVSQHRAVAMAWIPNPSNLPEVNHKDLNKLNNNKANLEWVTPKTNTQHAWNSGTLRHRTVPVIGVHAATGAGIYFRSISEAKRQGFHMYKALKSGGLCGGYLWTTP